MNDNNAHNELTKGVTVVAAEVINKLRQENEALKREVRNLRKESQYYAWSRDQILDCLGDTD